MTPRHLAFFQDMAERIDRAWKEREYALDVFPDLAAEALTQRPPSAEVDPADILRGVLEAPALVHPDSRLGEPSVTLHQCGRFYIHALFWLTSTTAVHDHSFSGAFSVLSGGSLHNHLEWTSTREVNDLFRIGRLTSRQTELLRPGDVRRILPGDSLIHTLFHLEHPSVSIVVRTFSHEARQFLYFPPTVSADGRRTDRHRETKLAALEALWVSRHPDAASITRDVVENADLATLFFVLRTVRSTSALSKQEKSSFFEQAAQKRPAEIPLFEAAFAEEARRNAIIQRRQFVRDADQRFLLALLLNLDNRREIDGIMRDRYVEEPATKIASILRQLAAVSRDGARSQTGLGVDLTSDELDILESLVRGTPIPELIRDLQARFDGVSVDHVERRIRSLTTHPTLAPLFR